MNVSKGVDIREDEENIRTKEWILIEEKSR